MNFRVFMFGATIMLLAGTSTAAPAPTIQLPGAIDAGRVLQDNQYIPEPKEKTAIIVSPAQIINPAPDGSENATFILSKLIIRGSTIYHNGELENIYDRYIGQKISLANLYEITGAITQLYRNEGYTLSHATLLPQKIVDGVVTITVVEGYIENVSIEGDYKDNYMVEQVINKIKSYRPLRTKDLESTMLLLNDTPGVSVKATLSATAGESHASPGATNLILTFKDTKKQSSSIYIDNGGSKYLGPYQAIFHTDMALFNDQLTSLNMEMTNHTKELQYMQASHSITLDDNGTKANFSAGYAHTRPGDTLANFDVISKSSDISAGISRPIIRSRTSNLTIGTDFTLSSSATDVLYTQLSNDRLRVLDAFINYDTTDSLHGSDSAQFKLSQGLDILGETKTGSANLSRADGHSDFTKITANIGRLQSLTKTLNLYLAGNGQYAWDSLLSSQQFGFGGQQFGRAYDPSEFTADNGIAGQIELRYSGMPVYYKFSTELFNFYDAGRVWNSDNSVAINAASAGIGARLSNQKNLMASLTLAQPIVKRVNSSENGGSYGPRILFSVGYTF